MMTASFQCRGQNPGLKSRLEYKAVFDLVFVAFFLTVVFAMAVKDMSLFFSQNSLIPGCQDLICGSG